MSDIVEVNATNLKGFTAMDVVDIVIESPQDLHLKETFQRAGPLRAQHANTISTASLQQVAKIEQAKNVLQPKSSNDLLNELKFKKERDSPHVVVAALIATVTFKAGVNPPDSILKGNPHPFDLETNAIAFSFVFANAMGLTASLSIITHLTIGFPFRRELLISMVSMVFAYGFAIASITKGGFPYTLLVAAFIITFFQRWVIIWGRKIWKGGDKLPVTSNDDGGSGTNC
ncbi:unnamed protein product [Ilex paraguariensis]|uniref:PGG domain-containing protein n=1 Tax=Ilex paraguariensis TaxID=185542 RepID=A0ABC8RZG9_9AQUA